MKNPEKRSIVVHVNCDTERLYRSIPDAIAYMQEVAFEYKNTNISLSEHWTGYEDMEMVFEYTREETDEEFNNRLEEEKRQAELLRERNASEAEREKRYKEYEKLKREFGR